MSMSVPGDDSDDTVLSEINTTPLVDVMLVLLIIFLITIPVATKAVKVSLPKAANIPTTTKPENITISVDSAGSVYWQGAVVADSAQLVNLAAAAARQVPQPEVHIRADINTRYEAIGRVIWAMQRASIGKVGFLTEPDHGTRGP